MQKSLISLILLISFPLILIAGFNFGFIKAVKKKVKQVDEKVIEKKEKIIITANKYPVISSVIADPTAISTEAVSTINCTASDADGDILTYVWSAASGSISGAGSAINWTAPASSGVYVISVTVLDGHGGSAQSDINVTVTNSPVLSWTGETDYVSNGLNPETGYSTTTFVYRVKYTDADDDAPVSGYPKVHIKKSGTEISGSPFSMTYVSGNYNTGAIYTFSITDLTEGATDYLYYFEAKDAYGVAATGAPLTSLDAPDIDISYRNWESVASGDVFTIAIADGTFWTWGQNNYGQLGLGDTTDRISPTQIRTDMDWSLVSAGGQYTTAIKTDGTLWAWGRNNYGQLGLGDTTDRTSPTQIGTDTDWSLVSAGYYHAMAIKTDGTLWAWGNNGNGRLGIGDITDRNTPTQVGADADWSSVSAGGLHTIAVKTNGTLWAWGYGAYGQLGLGDETDKYNPTQIGTDTDWSSVAGGVYHTIAIKTDGTLWAWGANGGGQLGLGDIINRNIPTQVGTDTNWFLVSVGVGSGHTTTAIKTDGTLWAWGQNNYGQLGLGDTTDRHSPTQVGTDTNWSFVSVGGYHIAAIKTNGTLWVCGKNNYGQLGLGDTTDRHSPTQVP